MSGHSKWSTIKRKKAEKDKRRGSIFTKVLKEIQVAAKTGGGDLDGNPRLKTAVLTAKSNSVPNDNIERAIKRGTGDLEGVDYEEITYEAYGPGGVAILIKTLTDNKNRTVAEIRHMLTRYGGSLGGTGSVAFQFEDTGVFTVKESLATEDDLFEQTVESGVKDIRNEEGYWILTCDVADFTEVRDALEKVVPEFEAQIQPIPNNLVSIEGQDAQSLIKCLDGLEGLDDIQTVVANFEMDDKEFELSLGA